MHGNNFVTADQTLRRHPLDRGAAAHFCLLPLERTAQAARAPERAADRALQRLGPHRALDDGDQIRDPGGERSDHPVRQVRSLAGVRLYALSWLAIVAKNLHNFVGPLFVFCTLVMFVTFVRDNAWRMIDWAWIRKGGGLATGDHIPSGRFNAGEKAWFWFGVTLLGIVVGASGLILDFPNFDQTRSLMQQANVVHAIAAVLYMAISLGHIYLGTIGMNGAYEAMRHGVVDETWAREHHEIWYEEVKAGEARQHFVDDVAPDVKVQVEQAVKA